MQASGEESTPISISKEQDYEEPFRETSPEQYSKVLEQAIITCKPALPEQGFDQWLEAMTMDKKDAIFQALIDNMEKLGGFSAVVKSIFPPPYGEQEQYLQPLQEKLLNPTFLPAYSSHLSKKTDGSTIWHYLAQHYPAAFKKALDSLPEQERRVAVEQQDKNEHHALLLLAAYHTEAFPAILESLPEDSYVHLLTAANQRRLTVLGYLAFKNISAFQAVWKKVNPLLSDEQRSEIFSSLLEASYLGATMVLQSLSTEEARSAVVQKTNALPLIASSCPSILPDILDLLPDTSYFEVLLYGEEGEDHSLYTLALRNPEQLETIWGKVAKVLTPKQLLQIIQASTFLHALACKQAGQATLVAILQSLSPAILLASITHKKDGRSFFHLLAPQESPGLVDALKTLPRARRLEALLNETKSTPNSPAQTVIALVPATRIKKVLQLLSKQDRLKALGTTGYPNTTLFHRYAKTAPWIFQAILPLLPKYGNEWSSAIQRQDKAGQTCAEILKCYPDRWYQHVASFMVSPNPAQKKHTVNTADDFKNLLLNASLYRYNDLLEYAEIKCEPALPAELERWYLTLEDEQRAAVSQAIIDNINKLGGLVAVIKFAFSSPEVKQPLQDMLLDIISLPEYMEEILKDEGEHDQPILCEIAAASPLVLKHILNSLTSNEERVAAVMKKGRGNYNVLHELACWYPEAFLDILELLPPDAYIELINQRTQGGSTFLDILAPGTAFEILAATWNMLSAALKAEALLAVVQADTSLHALAGHWRQPGAFKALQAILTTLSTFSSSHDILLAAIQKKDGEGKTFFHILAQQIHTQVNLQATLQILPDKLRLAALGEKDQDEATVLHYLACQPDVLIESLRLLLKDDPNWQTVMNSKDKEGCGFVEIFLSKNPSVGKVKEVRALVPFQRENITLHELAFLEGEALGSKLDSLPLNQRLNAIQEKNNSGDNVLHVLAMSDPENIPSILSKLPSTTSYLDLLQQPNRFGRDVLTILKGHKDGPNLLFTTWRVMTKEWLASSNASETCAAVMDAYDAIDSDYLRNKRSLSHQLRVDELLSPEEKKKREDRLKDRLIELDKLMLLVNAVYEAYHLLEQEVLTAKKIAGHETSQSLTAASQQAIDERVAYLNECADNLKSFILAGSLPKRVFVQLCRFVGAIIGGLLFFAVGVRNGAYYGEQAACKLLGGLFLESDKNLYEFAQTVIRSGQISAGTLPQSANRYDNSRGLGLFGVKPSQPKESDDNSKVPIKTPYSKKGN